MIPALTQETKSKISTAAAPKPPASIDPNVGKKASMKSGAYVGIHGIIYPRAIGLNYIGEFDEGFVGEVSISNKPYLLMFFYEDGTFFCAVNAEPAELDIVGGYTPPPSGEGTIGDPFTCDHDVQSGSGIQQFYHQLPDYAGTVILEYNMYEIPDKLEVFFSGETEPVASTNGYKTNAGYLSFYYDPAFNPRKILVKVNDGYANSGTSWIYQVHCPTEVAES